MQQTITVAKKRSWKERLWSSPKTDAGKIKNAWGVAIAIGILSLAGAVLSLFLDFLSAVTSPAMIPFSAVLIALAYWGEKHNDLTVLTGFLVVVIIDFIFIIVFTALATASGMIGGLVIKALFAYWLSQGVRAFKSRGSLFPGILLGIGLELLAVGFGVAWALLA